MTPDFFNGLFEFIGAVMIAADVRQIYRDKAVHGIYWPGRVFFTVWGGWNLFYYPSLDQWWSFSGGLAIAILNVIWLAFAIYYRDKFWKGLSI